jgi:hypothetical protein
MIRNLFAKAAYAAVTLLFFFGGVRIYAQSAAVSSVAPPSTVYDLDPLGKKPEMAEPNPLLDWLPIWGKSAKDKGFDLPLPLGIGLTYTYIHQNMVVSDVRIHDRPLNLNIRDAETTTHTAIFRADAWVFPFLNVYGLLGQTIGDTRPALVFPNGQVLETKVDYSRFSYGAGMTVAGGWKSFFLTLDANWTSGPIVSTEKGQVGDEPIQSLTFAPRFGILMSSGHLGTGSLWIGGMCLIATSEIHDKVDLSPHPLLARLVDMNSLSYSVQVKPKDKWNLLIGGNWELNKRWSLTGEVGGVLDRFHTIGGVMFRF